MLQISLRVHLGSEITSNPAVCSKAMRAYRWIRSGDTPSSLLFPLFPTPARVRRIIGGAQLFQIVAQAYTQRKESPSPRTDIMQVLLDNDYDVKEAASVCLFVRNIWVYVLTIHTLPAFDWNSFRRSYQYWTRLMLVPRLYLPPYNLERSYSNGDRRTYFSQ